MHKISQHVDIFFYHENCFSLTLLGLAMELSQGAVLSLPLFQFNDELPNRDLDHPDLYLEVVLDEQLLAHLCQNPAQDQSVSLQLADYQLLAHTESVPSESHSAMLMLTHGPLLAATLERDNGVNYVSPQLEMMPTFDLGDDDE